jgi:transcriptional regulator GlxA family with amidase domain
MPPAGELCDRLRAASGWPKRLCQSDGRLRVDELARDAGYSRRHLTARFRAEYGLAPKTAARVMRFERARALVARPEPPALARIAAACGYADQAHMNREWRALAGASPLGWRAAEVLPFVQDGDRASGAQSGA